MYSIKKEKQTIQLTLCQLGLGGWRKEKGMRLSQGHSQIIAKQVVSNQKFI